MADSSQPAIPPVIPPAVTPVAVQAVTPTIPSPPDWRKPSFDFLGDSTKQLITVATGVVTATVLFSKDIDPSSKQWALAAWIVLTFSVLCGIAVLFNMSGNLHSAAEGKSSAPSVIAKGIPFFSIFQIFSFLIGMVLMVLFGLFAKPVHVTPEPKQPISVTCLAPPPLPAKETATTSPANAQKGSGKKKSKKTHR